MKTVGLLLVIVIVLSCNLHAQSPMGRKLGFGISLGEPLGLTGKMWTERNAGFVGYIGASYYGSPRIGVDYHWHFDAFNSDIFSLFVGPGALIGFGEGRGVWYNRKGDVFIRKGGDLGLGVRGIVGVNAIPRSSPFEIYLEIGVLLGIVPGFGSAVDAALGFRFYP